MREVERQCVECATVDDQKLVVIAHKIVGGARNGNSGAKQAHLQFSEAFFAASIGIGNQGRYQDAAAHSRFQSCFQLGTVEPENDDVDALPGLLDCSD